MQKTDEKDCDYLLKLLVVGDAAVGKTNLILRYTENMFLEDHRRMAFDFKIRNVTLQGKKVKLQIWDTEPPNRFRYEDTTYMYRGTRGIMIAYNAADKESFENIKIFLSEIDRYAREDVCKVLVQTKCDENMKESISTDVAKEFADAHGLQFFKTSAKTNNNVDNAFMALVQDAFDKIAPYISDPGVQKLQISGEGPMVNITYSTTGTIALQATNPWKTKGVEVDMNTIYYYEVAIKSTSSGFNVGLATSKLPVTYQSLGLYPDSYGYHGDDGLRIINGGYRKTGWPKIKKGMVVGIGFVVATHTIFGTLDGKLLGELACTDATQLIPTIGFHKPGEVQVIFDQYIQKLALSKIKTAISFRNIEELGRTEPQSKLLVLFFDDSSDLALRDKMQKTVEGVAQDLSSKYSYKTCYSFTQNAKALEIRKKFAITSSRELVAINFKEGTHCIFPKEMDFTAENILMVFPTFMAPKSALRPPQDKDPQYPTLIQVVATSFTDLVLRGTKDVLLNVYHQENFHTVTMEILAKIYSNNENIVIAQIDSAKNDLDPKYFSKASKPTIKLFGSHNKERPITYKGNGTIENIVEFLQTHSRPAHDLETARNKALEEADLRQLREIVERRHKKLDTEHKILLEGTEDWQKIRDMDKLLLEGISSLTPLPSKELISTKEFAKSLLSKAFNLLDQEKLPEAKCYLELSAELEKSNENEKMMLELQSQIKEREKLSEHELQMRVEARINTIKADIIHAEQQAQKVKTQAERDMINQQLVVLHLQEETLQDQIAAYEVRNQKLQEREAQVEQREQLLSEQTAQLEQLLAELVSTTATDVSALQQQMAVVVAGDKDVDSARRRFASMQKAAKDAQQALVVEERRQRERVEWLQKQMDLYQVKGMSPAQLTFRNFLKDVKRLAAVRHQLEHTPYPLRCFISYAWETDQESNKELQKRLQRLKDELETAGMEVMLDIRDMKFDMKKFMVQNIERAHKLLLICTPRLQVRAADPVKNNLQLELETALEKERSSSEFVVPLILSGSFHEAMPPQVSHLLSISLTSPADHYPAMASLAPMGLIPMLLGLERNKDYKRIHDRLFMELEDYEQP